MSHSEAPESFVSFGALLRYLRVRARMSQRELSIAVGYSEAHLSRLEQGHRRPDLDVVRARLIPALNLEPASPWAGRLLTLARAPAAEQETPRHTEHGADPVAPPAQARPSLAPAPAQARRPTNLPAALSSFIGRDREQAALRHLLPTTRLLTLTGPGGAGKTRLASEVARALLGAYPDGVWLVPLAQLSDPDLVAQATLDALGAPEAQGQPALTLLTELLGERRLLLVLDNCEHLVAACAELAARLLAACPELRILATSREPLRVGGELVWPTPALATPELARMPRAGDLLLYDAVRLFVERARAARPGFDPPDSELITIARICASVDGLPLAVELAAAWARALSVAEIAARLEARLRLLVGAERSAPPRHLSLRATLDWSHALLSEGERVLMRRLGVFAGGFTLASAEAVGAGDGLAADEILPLLAQLVDRSLVTVAPGASGESWYAMLETIREYALLRLREAGEEDTARERHLEWCQAVAATPRSQLRGELHAAMAPWHDNLRAAMAFSLVPHSGRATQALELAANCSRYWELCGHLGEGRRWLAEAIAHNPTPSLVWARAQWMAGNLAKAQGDLGEAEERYRASLAWYREGQDAERIAGLLKNLGNLALERGDYEEARDFYEDALELYHKAATPGALGSVHNNLGELAVLMGDYARAERLFAASLAYYQQAGDRWAVADVTGNRGWLVALRGGDLARAAELLATSVAAMAELGTTYTTGLRLCQLGDVLWARGEQTEAVCRYRQSLELLREIRHHGQLAALFESVAQVAVETTGAARLLGAAAALRRAAGTPLAPIEERRRAARLATLDEALGSEQAAAQLALGEALGIAQAIAAAEDVLDGLAAGLADAL